MPFKIIREFIKLESASGIILFSMAIIALILDNSRWSSYYDHFFHTILSVHIGQFYLSKPLILWINDGLMAIFFLLVGLEIKREIYKGELNSLAKITLPGIAAIGGMIAPALFFIALNHHDPVAIRGWAIPTATDIAFSLAILSLLGSRIPVALKLFLTALAIFDDIGAIIIIAIFYAAKTSWQALSCASITLLCLYVLNRSGVTKLLPYFIIGFILWFCVLKSGVHATLSGVALAFAIPLKDPKRPRRSPLEFLEHILHPWVAYLILPLFALANAGVSFVGLNFRSLFDPLTLGIAGGLLIGKQVGVLASTYLAIKLGIAKLPDRANWLAMWGISLICGVGFTMSLFIGTLAFNNGESKYGALVRLGVLSGSLLSGFLGYIVLWYGAKLNKKL